MNLRKGAAPPVPMHHLLLFSPFPCPSPAPRLRRIWGALKAPSVGCGADPAENEFGAL